MGFADFYLVRQKGNQPYIADPPSEKLGYVIVIPVYCEPDLHLALESLWRIKRPRKDTEVLMVVNSAENSDPLIRETNLETIRKTQEWIESHKDPSLRFFIMHLPDVPAKEAGVGMARKAGMDEALFRFNTIDNPVGFVLSFDADSTCDANYLAAVEETVTARPGIQGFTVYFEHPLEGNEYPAEVYQGIAEYELHLRYVNQFLRFAGFPDAFHTVGSCFGVRADIYAAQGGMNKKQGGEDFYFLHKVIPLGHFCDITSTTVVPSPRPSFRVPFGTGPAITKRLTEGNEMQTYAPECFMDLKQFFSVAGTFYRNSEDQIRQKLSGLSPALCEFLEDNNAVTAILETDANTGSAPSFVNRFFRWFDAFRIVKFLNYSGKIHYPRVRVSEGAFELLKLLGVKVSSKQPRALLDAFRRLEKS